MTGFLHWLNTPFRVVGSAIRFVFNMNARQVRSLFSVGMLGGIIALSLQNIGLMLVASRFVKEPDSLFGVMAINQQFWNNVIMAGFAVAVAVVVWNVDRLKAKVGRDGGEVDFDRRDEE